MKRLHARWMRAAAESEACMQILLGLTCAVSIAMLVYLIYVLFKGGEDL